MKKMGMAGLALVIVGALVFGAGYIGARGDLSVVNGNLGPFRVQLTDGHVHSGFFSTDGDSSKSGIGGGRNKPVTTPPVPTPTPIRDVDTGSDADSQSFKGEDVREIEINAQGADVVILPSFDGKVTVSAQKLEVYSISLDKNGVLSVEKKGKDKVTIFGLNLTGDLPELRVTMPKEQITSLEVNNSCGNITLEKHALGEVELETDMGDVYVHLTECLSAELSSDCGEVKAFHLVSSRDLSADCDMGDVRLENCEAGGKLTADSSCGKVTVIDCTAVDAELGSDLGDVAVSNLDCVRDVSIDCDCGAIKLSKLSAGRSIEIENSMGSIEGTLAGSISDYSIESKTDLGSNNLPSKLELGTIKLKVHDSCGSIDIDFEED